MRKGDARARGAEAQRHPDQDRERCVERQSDVPPVAAG